MYTFISNKSFGQLLDISSKNFIFLKILNSEFSFSEVWFTDQKFKPLEIKDSPKLLGHPKRSATDVFTTKIIQKTAKATGDLIGNKIANRITKVSKKITTKIIQKQCYK